ncbi:MAG: hypothetical protein JW940_27330 [Polyangiaceae bacterium]|nr:hypothetical protein [Polyangiaceae bacterium]
MNLKAAVDALIYLWQNSDPFNGTNALYSAVRFVPEYPQAGMATPAVGLSLAGGVGVGKEIGWANRWRTPRIQVDILAADMLAATRIYQHMRTALITDLNHAGATGDAGDPGKGYLHAQGIRRVVMGEPIEQPWDDAGRVRRLVADAEPLFADA